MGRQVAPVSLPTYRMLIREQEGDSPLSLPFDQLPAAEREAVRGAMPLLVDCPPDATCALFAPSAG